MRAVIIPPDGPPQVRDVQEDISVLQGIVGGYIEGVAVPGLDAHAYVNEDGRRLGLPHNHVASDLLGQAIVGTVIVLGSGRIPDEDDVPHEVLVRLGLS